VGWRSEVWGGEGLLRFGDGSFLNVLSFSGDVVVVVYAFRIERGVNCWIHTI